MKTIKSEGERCLKCKKPNCAAHCPVNTPVPEVVKVFLTGDIKKAGEILFANNPLSAVTSVVCPHEKNCTGHCVLGNKGDPIEFFKIEQYVSRYYLETFEAPEIEKKDIRVAVAGGGPSGITMSLILANKGYEVTLFEAEGDIGGVLRYGIPDFRLAKDLLSHYKTILEKMGVKIRLNTRIGTNINIEDLFIDGYKAVFMGIGAGRPNRLGLLGETLGNVHFAIDYLKSPGTYNLGRKVAVVGAGNVAIDAARTAVRKAHADVVVINRMGKEDAPASRLEVEMAEIDGVQFIHNAQVVRIKEDSVSCVAVQREVQEDGSLYFEEDFSETFELPVDSVILAIGQGPGAELQYGNLVDLTGRGYITTNDNGETSTENVYAGGDIVTGPSTVVQAVASTINAAQHLLKRLEEIEKNGKE